MSLVYLMEKGDRKTVFLAVVLLVLALIVVGYINFQKGYPNDLGSNNVSLANPASAYCIDHGGNLSILTNSDGSQVGICLLPGGIKCDEWAYFRGECGNSAISNECNIDSDCLKVQSTCCACSSGGEEKCVNKNESQMYATIIANCSKLTICAQIYACTNQNCGCIHGRCSFIS